MRAMELMDLPDDILASILAMAIEQDYYAVDIALCSKRWLEILNSDSRKIISALAYKPWMINFDRGIMTAWDVFVYEHDPKGLRRAIKYLKEGVVKYLHIVGADQWVNVSPEGNLIANENILNDQQFAELLEGIPINKLILSYSNI